LMNLLGKRQQMLSIPSFSKLTRAIEVYELSLI